MRRKLTLVVTCTDRKSAPPNPRHMVRHLRQGTTAERAEAWRSSLNQATDKVELRQLYQGATWAQTLRLEQAATRAGFEPRVLVASAGLGLREISSAAPAYAATFAPYQPDSVAHRASERRLWWDSMSSSDESTAARVQLQGPTLFVLSASYAEAMAVDLDALRERDDVVVFGGSDATPDRIRIRADKQLRTALGGTATSLNARTAIAWIERLPAPSIPPERAYPAWRTWARQSQRRESFDRRTLSDAQVGDFVRSLRETTPEISKSRALRALRDAGLACEQKRFARLFGFKENAHD